MGVRSTWLEHKSILCEFNKGKIKVEKGKTPSDGRENTPGLQQNHYRAPPSARYRVPSHGGDATGNKINKQQKKQTKQNYRKNKRKEQAKHKYNRKNRQYSKLLINDKQPRHPHDRATFRKNKNERKDCQQNQKPRS